MKNKKGQDPVTILIIIMIILIVLYILRKLNYL